MVLSDVCLSVAYIGNNPRTKRPMKTKIGTQVAHVTCDSDTTFKVKRCRVSLSTRCGVHLRPNDGKDQSLYFINFITK